MQNESNNQKENKILFTYTYKIIIILLFSYCNLIAQNPIKTIGQNMPTSIKKINHISKSYLEFWNSEIQKNIDNNIEHYRKANAICHLKNINKGTIVKVEQISHSFLFGGNIFLFGDLKSPEKNKKYEETFGTLLNAATIAFYWKTLEPEKGKPRYEAESPYIYRRPPTDPVVAFCEKRGINMNGHPIIYGLRKWGHPTWMQENRKEMEKIFEAHIQELAERYKHRIQRWDVVNEPIDQPNRGLMPDDYTFKSYSWAMKYFPKSVKFNMNDCDIQWGPNKHYVVLVRDLIDRGVRIDYTGIQMHIFNPADVTNIANGADILTPEKNYAVLDCLRDIERPIHISEVTIPAPNKTKEGFEIQAIIARNLYRLWFSYPQVMGITWWNLVDESGAPGEPSFSGLYDIGMNTKPVYHVLDTLINREWKTNLIVQSCDNGVIRFRGFKGTYKISWIDKSGKEQNAEFILEKDGDGYTG